MAMSFISVGQPTYYKTLRLTLSMVLLFKNQSFSHQKINKQLENHLEDLQGV